jgi:hypothetical protein
LCKNAGLFEDSLYPKRWPKKITCSPNQYGSLYSPKESISIRFLAETDKIRKEKYNEHIKISTNGSKKDEKVRCAVIKPGQKFRKRLKPQKTVYSAEQAIYVTQRTNERRVTITDCLSTLMAEEGDINSKIPTVTQKTTGRKKRESHPSLVASPCENTRKLNCRRRSKSCHGRRPLIHRKIPTTRSD